ncbi:MAG: DUF4157 domain-containing protein [Bacteroidota bacterium]
MKKAPVIQSKSQAKPGPVVQKKLKIGKPNDKHEQQADAVADQVMKMPDEEEKVSMSAMDEESAVQMQSEEEEPVQMQPEDEESVQMQPEEEEVAMKEDEEVAMKEEEEVAAKEDEEVAMQEDEEVATKEDEEVQKKPLIQRSGDGQTTATPALSSQLNATKGGGRSLPKDVNQEMSQKIGSDFSNVRVHTDSKAVEMNEGLGAKAFAHGNDVYFNTGNFNPDQPDGKRLLAHELTHVVQQKGKIQPKIQRKGGSKDVVPFPRGNFYSQRKVRFLSTKKKPNIRVTFNHKANVHGKASAGSFKFRIDNATRTKENIVTSDVKRMTTVREFKMNNVGEHHVYFEIHPEDKTWGLSVNIGGKIERF